MTYKEYKALRDDALSHATPEEYIARCGGTAPAQVLVDIWTVAHNPTFATLQGISGMGNKKFSDAYGIKLRTIEDWRSHTRMITQTFFDLLCADVITEKNKI